MVDYEQLMARAEQLTMRDLAEALLQAGDLDVSIGFTPGEGRPG